MSIQTAVPNTLTLFLCGDVMTGRGIDQILPHPSAPQIHEPYVSSAYEYVELAERAHGRIEKPPGFSYIWGDILPELERHRPAVRIANLETAVTTSDDACSGKGIHYRMHPRNVECLTAAGLDCCVLANNHTLDWGREGLAETLRVLRGDIVVMSLHWGDNWGYEVTREQQQFAYQLIDEAGVDIVHGHSSHHPRPIEVYRGKLILYGCGDLLNDYEGIGGYERYRSELGLMYFPVIDRETHQLVRLTISPTCIRRLRVNLAQRDDARWLAATLSRECASFGTSLQLLPAGDLALEWPHEVKAIA